MDAYWHEDFIGFPAGTNINAFSGVGWSASSTISNECRKVASTAFSGGSAIQFDNNSIPTTFTIPVSLLGVTNVLSWKMRRTINWGYTGSARGGVQFNFANGNAILLQFDQLLSDAIRITSIIGVTVTTLFTTPNIYLFNVVYDYAFEHDPTTGTFSVYINNALAYSTTIADFLNTYPVSVSLGRFGTGTGSGTAQASHFFGYYNSGYVGPVEIRSSFAISDDVLQDWTFTGGVSAWESINNTYLNPPTQYIESSAAAQISEFNAAVDDSEVFGVYSVSVEYYGYRTDVLGVNMNSRLTQGASATPGATNVPPQTTPQVFRDFWTTTNPNTGVGWLPSDLPSLGFGVERT